MPVFCIEKMLNRVEERELKSNNYSKGVVDD